MNIIYIFFITYVWNGIPKSCYLCTFVINNFNPESKRKIKFCYFAKLKETKAQSNLAIIKIIFLFNF